MAPLSAYGAFAIARDYRRSREEDQAKFEQQLASFQVNNPSIAVSRSGRWTSRYYITYKSPGGQTKVEFQSTKRKILRRRSELQRQGLKVCTDWLSPNCELEDQLK
jgi:hypothetical protein